MKPITFVITREDVYGHILATSAHVTRSREAMGTPTSIGESMLITTDEKEMLDPHIRNSVNNVFCDIVRYHPGSNVETTQEEFKFTINTPSNYPDENGEKLKESIESYIANRTLQSWYTDVKPDEAAITATKTKNEAETLHALLTQREKPHN